VGNKQPAAERAEDPSENVEPIPPQQSAQENESVPRWLHFADQMFTPKKLP
jgi:hypothetical protein